MDNQGWWSTKSRSGDENDNYFVGEGGKGEMVRNFFTFKLPQVEGKVVGARLAVRRYRAGGNARETLNLYHVRTPAREVNRNRGRDPQIFRDLGTGTRYGRFRVATDGVSSDSLLRLWLNRPAIVEINAARGGYFSIGGRLASTSRADMHLDSLFRFSEVPGRKFGRGLQELRLFIEPPA